MVRTLHLEKCLVYKNTAHLAFELTQPVTISFLAGRSIMEAAHWALYGIDRDGMKTERNAG